MTQNKKTVGKTAIGTKLKSKVTGEVFEVCERDAQNDLLGMPYKGITVQNVKGEHLYLPFANLHKFQEVTA